MATRTTAFAATLGLAAACWVVTLWRMEGLNMGVATRLDPFPGEYVHAEGETDTGAAVRVCIGPEFGTLGDAAMSQEEYSAARALSERALTISRSAGLTGRIAGALKNLGQSVSEQFPDFPALSYLQDFFRIPRLLRLLRRLYTQRSELLLHSGSRASIASCARPGRVHRFQRRVP